MNYLLCLPAFKQDRDAKGLREKPRSDKALCRIDKPRMDAALASHSFEVPQGLSAEQIRQHILASSKFSK